MKNSQLGEMVRAGYMKRTHPVGRQLDLLARLAGGFLLYVPAGSFGGENENWCVLLPTRSNNCPAWKVNIPISSTLEEARAMLARGVGEALGR